MQNDGRIQVWNCNANMWANETMPTSHVMNGYWANWKRTPSDPFCNLKIKKITRTSKKKMELFFSWTFVKVAKILRKSPYEKMFQLTKRKWTQSKKKKNSLMRLENTAFHWKIPCTKRHIHKRTTHKYTFTCPDTKIHLLINCHTLNQNPQRKKIVFFL